MKRREFLQFAAALPAFGAPEPLPQRLRPHRYGPPVSPVARYRAGTIGGKSHGAALTGWQDISGNGNDLVAANGAPRYTTAAVNRRPGVWCGSRNPLKTQGYFAIPSTVTLPGNSRSVLVAGQFGGASNYHANSYVILGQPAMANFSPAMYVDGSGAYFKHYDFANGAQPYATTTNDPAGLCGPTALAHVFGSGPAGSSISSPRMRQFFDVRFSSAPVSGGYIGGNFGQADVTFHEILLYDRALNNAELDQWFAYSRQEYGSVWSPGPALVNTFWTRYPDAVPARLVFVGDSMTEGMAGTYTQSFPNQLLHAMNAWSFTEFVNTAIGAPNQFGAAGTGTQIAGAQANLSQYLDLYEFTLPNMVYVVNLGSMDIVEIWQQRFPIPSARFEFTA